MGKSKKVKKTNAMRLLDSKKIAYIMHEYQVIGNQLDGVSVAKLTGQNPDKVFKTLVTKGVTGDNYVFVIPVNRELSLKKAAKAVNEKKIEMIPLKELLSKTGYIHGGCSPVGMTKQYFTVIDESSKNFETIIFSGGLRGLQIELSVENLLNVINGVLTDISE